MAARVARASRIYVEGRHDAELIAQVWGEDLRIEGVVVEQLGGVDAYLRVRGEPRVPQDAGERADAALRSFLAAVWVEGRNLSDPAELDRLDAVGRDVPVARWWQSEFEALPRPITPTLVLPDGYVSRGLGALARLAALAGAPKV